MTKFKTYIKQENKRNKMVLGFLFLGFIILLIHPVIISNFTQTISAIILAIGILSAISLLIIITFFGNSNFIEGIVANGFISFTEQQVNFNEQSFNLEDLTDIHIYYAGYPKSKEQIHVYKTGNFIKFNIHNVSYKVFFIIENELERQQLVALLKQFQEKGLKFKETTSQGNSYFLDINLSYAEIQNLKNK